MLNVLTGERYKTITKETEGVLRGEYGAVPAPVNKALQDRVLCGDQPITDRPADRLKPEFEKLKAELLGLAEKENLQFGDNIDDDVLTYALFPQPALKFLANRNNPDAFEPPPGMEEPASEPVKGPASSSAGDSEVYTVEVQGQQYVVRVSPGGDLQSAEPVVAAVQSPGSATGTIGVTAPLAGDVLKVIVSVGDQVQSGDVVVILEAMKMETEIRTSSAGQIRQVLVREGDSVAASDTLVTLG